MFKIIASVPKQCTTLERAPYLDRPDLKFICKMRKAGVFTAATPCFSLKNSFFFISLQLVLDLHYGWGTDGGSEASFCIHTVSFLLSYFLQIELGTVVVLKKSNDYPRNARILSLCFRSYHWSVKIPFCLFLSTLFLAFRLYKAWNTTPEQVAEILPSMFVEEPSCTYKPQGSFLFLVGIPTLTTRVLL